MDKWEKLFVCKIACNTQLCEYVCRLVRGFSVCLFVCLFVFRLVVFVVIVFCTPVWLYFLPACVGNICVSHTIGPSFVYVGFNGGLRGSMEEMIRAKQKKKGTLIPQATSQLPN
eukprot:gene1463-852_t